MKIALVDNMNNNFFASARYMRELGYEVDLYVIPDAADHFHPRADTHQDVTQYEWVKVFPIPYKSVKTLFFGDSKLQIFHKYDIVAACGYATALLQRAGITVDAFLPFGSDIYAAPFGNFFPDTISGRLKQAIYMACVGRHMRAAIQKASLIVTDLTNTTYRTALEQLGVTATDASIPIVYNRETPSQILNPYAGSDFVVFSHTRQYWASNIDDLPDFDQYLGWKRNDKLIRAFASLVKTKEKAVLSPLLVLFEYGPDVEASKQLIADLDIAEYVMWEEMQPRKDILPKAMFAHVGCDQFREGIPTRSGVAFEFASIGVPLLTHYLKQSHRERELRHIINVLTEDDIYAALLDLANNETKRQTIAAGMKDDFDRYFGIDCARWLLTEFQAILEQKTSGSQTQSAR